jgi:carbon-monoxide dehydrogenase iron sulfur subunit
MTQPKEIFVRMDRCTGCHSCELACAVEHSQSKNLYEALFERPSPKHRLYVEFAPPGTAIPVLCRHDENPSCMYACVTGAITRTEDGAVITNTDKCIGCWTCVMVCPYGVIGRDMELRKIYRCDRCPDREVPACVDACPTKALVYRTVLDFSKTVRQDVSQRMLSGEEE